MWLLWELELMLQFGVRSGVIVDTVIFSELYREKDDHQIGCYTSGAGWAAHQACWPDRAAAATVLRATCSGATTETGGDDPAAKRAVWPPAQRTAEATHEAAAWDRRADWCSQRWPHGNGNHNMGVIQGYWSVTGGNAPTTNWGF